MAKEKKNEARTEKQLAWIAAETARLVAASALKAAEELTARTASEFGAELKAAKKNGAVGPDDVVYIVQSCRKSQPSDKAPVDGEHPSDKALAYPYTMRRAQTITM